MLISIINIASYVGLKNSCEVHHEYSKQQAPPGIRCGHRESLHHPAADPGFQGRHRFEHLQAHRPEPLHLYANYVDIFDLADKLRKKLETDFAQQFAHDGHNAYLGNDGALRMFRHIRDNQLFYKTYFKLGYDKAHTVLIYDTARAEQDFHNEHIDYHIEFFRAGLNAIIKRWLENGCQESPEVMAAILQAEYRNR